MGKDRKCPPPPYTHELREKFPRGTCANFAPWEIDIVSMTPRRTDRVGSDSCTTGPTVITGSDSLGFPLPLLLLLPPRTPKEHKHRKLRRRPVEKLGYCSTGTPDGWTKSVEVETAYLCTSRARAQ